MVPAFGDFLRRNPQGFVAFLGAVNIILRFVTSGKVWLFPDDDPPRARIVEESAAPPALGASYRENVFAIKPVPLVPRGLERSENAKPERPTDLLRILRQGDSVTCYPKEKLKQTPDNLKEGKVISVEGKSCVVEDEDGLLERLFFGDWHISLSIN